MLRVEQGRVSLWVEAWQRIVGVRAPVGGWGTVFSVGQRVTATAYCDMGQRNWKRRIVMRLA